MPEAFAPRKSGQLAFWVLPSRINGSNEAATWQRKTTIVCQTGKEIAERLSVVVCKEFALNIKSARCPRAFVSSFLGATCFRELHCLFWWLSGSAPHREGRTAKHNAFHENCAKTGGTFMCSLASPRKKYNTVSNTPLHQRTTCHTPFASSSHCPWQ